MDNQPKKNTENTELGDAYGEDNGNRPATDHTDNSGSDSLNDARDNPNTESVASAINIDDTEEYLTMEQQGVQYTKDTDPTVNSDQMDFNEESHKNEWNSEGGNSLNSEAFNQDDYMLDDNVDLDEDQNQSVSTDDEDFEGSNEKY